MIEPCGNCWGSMRGVQLIMIESRRRGVLGDAEEGLLGVLLIA